MAQAGDGRDHNPYGYSMWMAGGGVKGGMATVPPTITGITRSRIGCTSTICTRPCCTFSGMDHKRLTYFYGGRNFRLTDVAGEVATKILA